MLMYVVCAGTQTEAREWACHHKVPTRQVLYASSTRAIEGLRDFAVVRLQGFFGREDADDIEAVLRRNEMKYRIHHAGCANGCGG
ncbi:hypothetical protein OG571_47835 (plasmid) [Streptomyces sp. NBC_01369]|uniref:hypothetical protein n=1 Tax=Streptomyces sp. NBC_01369 TaxID=2903842 RepID=UPI003254BC56